MATFWSELARRLERDDAVFLAVVVASTAGSPGTAGAKLLVTRDGEQVGTIGGGVMESRLVERAKAALRGGPFFAEARTLRHSERGPDERSGMICSGHQTNVAYLCRRAADLGLVERAARLVEAARGGTLALAPAGLALDERPIDPSAPPYRWTQSRGAWRYEEDLLERRRLAILGAGHCGRALARVMARVGWDVLVFDTRGDVATFRAIEEARRKEVVADYAEAGPRIDYPEITRVVVLTSDFGSDVRALSGLLGGPFPFLGLMGSAAKVARIRSELGGAGHGAAALDRIVAPVGLAIGSDTPEEIAISVAAQLIQHQRTESPEASPRSRRRARSPARRPRPGS